MSFYKFLLNFNVQRLMMIKEIFYYTSYFYDNFFFFLSVCFSNDENWFSSTTWFVVFILWFVLKGQVTQYTREIIIYALNVKWPTYVLQILNNNLISFISYIKKINNIYALLDSQENKISLCNFTIKNNIAVNFFSPLKTIMYWYILPICYKR
jgi:hypothetical protein